MGIVLILKYQCANMVLEVGFAWLSPFLGISDLCFLTAAEAFEGHKATSMTRWNSNVVSRFVGTVTVISVFLMMLSSKWYELSVFQILILAKHLMKY